MKSLFTLAAALILCAHSALATTYHVTTSGNDTANGTHWTTAFRTIQKALSVAASGDSIRVAAGTYYPDEGPDQIDNNRDSTFSLIGGVSLTGGYDPAGSGSYDPALYTTILSGDIDQNDNPSGNNGNSHHVLAADGVGSGTFLNGFTITGGNADGRSSGVTIAGRGGGLYCLNSAALTLANCSFQDNSATYDGAAIYNDSASPSLDNCTFTSNRGGSAIFNLTSSPTFTNCSFHNNSGSFGGAIYNSGYISNPCYPVFTNCSFHDNYARWAGGAMHNHNSHSSFTNCLFKNNSVANNGNSRGGAISNYLSSPTFANCSFRDNSSGSGRGGAIHNKHSSSPSFFNCSFQDNSSGSGGAVCNDSDASNPCSPSFTNCSLHNNSATWEGGAIYNYCHAVNSQSFPSLANCIVWNNSASGSTTSTSASVANYSYNSLLPIPSYSHCIIANSGGSGISWASDLGTDLGNNLDTDPLFVSSTDLHLQPGSPCIDAGDNASYPATAPATDLAGEPRIQDGTINLGAYESPPLPPPTVTIVTNPTLSRQTGLYGQTITVTNVADRAIEGFDLSISNIPAGVTLYNGSSTGDGTPGVAYHQRLEAGASVTLVLEYHAPVRGTVLEPEVSVSLVTEPDTDPSAPDGGLAVDRCLRQPDGSLLIEFTATPGALYEIHYSDDGESWKLSPVRVRAAGNRIQWIDRGPPRTDSPPLQQPCRFYRVRQLPGS